MIDIEMIRSHLPLKILNDDINVHIKLDFFQFSKNKNLSILISFLLMLLPVKFSKFFLKRSLFVASNEHTTVDE